MKAFLIATGVVILLLVGSFWWSGNIQSNEPDIISTTGIHWHPELEIFVEGEKIEIPQNTGLIGKHSPIHTHEDLPIIHLEFEGIVRKDDVRLSRFFEVWRKDFKEFSPNVSMTVNGQENTELESYIMQNGDKIVLRYFN